MARNTNYRNEGITFIAVGVILGCTLFVVGADGLSAVLGYACAVVVFVLGALMIRRGRGGGG
jgi:hypothetical protein